jgi:arylsulfatase A-like enzyme
MLYPLISALVACGFSEPTPTAVPPAPVSPAALADPTPAEVKVPVKRPNVLLVVLDTVRADHMSLYGYERPTSPRLTDFAATATRYDRAQAAAPWTLPSHASIFTGLYPFEHGAHTYEKSELKKKGIGAVLPLSKQHLTLTEYLADEHDYETGAVVANKVFLGRKFGVGQGFDFYDNEGGMDEEIHARGLAWLDGVSKDDPWFLFLNLMDAHRPYNCVEHPDFPYHGPPSRSAEVMKKLHPLSAKRKTLPPEDQQALVDMYDTALANQDLALGALFDALAERGRLDDTLIIITADHGEFLGEHDLLEHSRDIYQGTIGVPLVVKLPGQTEGAIDTELISHVHIAGLVLDAMGAKDDVPLTKHWPRGNTVFAENYYTRTKDLRAPWGGRFNRVRTGVFQGPWKYIHSSDKQHELFDLAADSVEANDLLSAQRKQANLLKRARSEAMDDAVWVPTAGGSDELSADDKSVLIELGYMDAGGDL